MLAALTGVAPAGVSKATFSKTFNAAKKIEIFIYAANKKLIEVIFMNKKGYIHHPIVAIIVGFLLGLLLMWLICKGIIPLGGLKIC
ncbi:hypothetical protein AYK26_01085 [Euryarchaeota archaeon SM23-78]|nr:MAG: hypothetical protein AYK26_01085 [Euryarchaeota archaeon SM23-78]